MLYFETGDEARIIPVDGRPHLPRTIRQWNGDSRGRWEGNTLVVETTNFSSKSNFMGSADGLHLIERFTRVAPDVLRYEMTFSDPTTWSRPWSAEIPLKQVDAELYEFACHEGNYEMVAGMLSAARADEKKSRHLRSDRPSRSRPSLRPRSARGFCKLQGMESLAPRLP